MTELAFENITKNKCLTCDDKLTAWEINYCIMCESDQEIENYFDDEFQKLEFFYIVELEFIQTQMGSLIKW